MSACAMIAFADSSSPGVAWEQTYDVQGIDQGSSMQQTSDGGFIMAGTADEGGSPKVCLVKASPNGSVEWKQTYAFGNAARGYSVLQATDGGYVVTGTVKQGDKYQVLLMKASGNGTQLWDKEFGDATSADVEGGGHSVRRMDDGGYVIAAQYPDPITKHLGLYLIRTDASGNKIWSATMGKNADLTAPSIERTTDGGFIVAGTIHTFDTPSAYDIDLIKFDSSGSMQWDKILGGSGLQYSGGDGSVQQTGDGGYIVVGKAPDSSNNEEAYLVKTDSSGNVKWEKNYNDTTDADAVQQVDGGYIIAGSSGKALILKVTSSGDEEWRQAGSTDNSAASSIQQTSDGGYVAFGNSGGNLYLLKLKPPVATPSTTTSTSGGLSGLFGGLFNKNIFADNSQLFGSTKPATSGESLFNNNGLFSTPSFSSFKLNDMPASNTSDTGWHVKSMEMPSFNFKMDGPFWKN